MECELMVLQESVECCKMVYARMCFLEPYQWLHMHVNVYYQNAPHASQNAFTPPLLKMLRSATTFMATLLAICNPSSACPSAAC